MGPVPKLDPKGRPRARSLPDGPRPSAALGAENKKKQARAVGVRNATHQVRPLQARVTAVALPSRTHPVGCRCANPQNNDERTEKKSAGKNTPSCLARQIKKNRVGSSGALRDPVNANRKCKKKKKHTERKENLCRF